MPVPFDGKEFTFFDPDGREIRVRGWGDQFEAVFETLDGYTIVQDPETQYFHYAQLSADGSTLLPSGPRVSEVPSEDVDLPQHIRTRRGEAKARAEAAQDAMGVRPRWQVRREQRRRERARPSSGDDEPEPAIAAAPVVGNYVGLCLLIEFPDVPGSIPQTEVSDFCNKPGYTGYGNNGSVRDYFKDVSGDKLTYTNEVTAYYTAKHERSHYTNPMIPYGQRARQLIIEALDDLKASGFNFDVLTSDSGGYVRALNVFYSGPTVNNWAKGLWPHASALTTPYVASSSRKFSDYQITDIGAQLTLQTFCHENGHMICDFPDLYDYGYESAGVGHFCLMCSGGSSKNPTHVCAYLKNEAGWTAKLRTMGPGMMFGVAHDVNDFLIHKRNDTEYFILENRAQVGRDASLPDAGLAIWHVDELGSNNNEQMTATKHYECSLEQADGRTDLELDANQGDGEDLFGAPDATAFGGSTKPSSQWWDGSSSGLEIVNISAPASTMTLETKSLWQHNRSVLRTHAKNGERMAWAYLDGGPWMRVDPKSTDGTQNNFLVLCEALANGRKVDVLVEDKKINQVTLR